MIYKFAWYEQSKKYEQWNCVSVSRSCLARLKRMKNKYFIRNYDKVY